MELNKVNSLNNASFLSSSSSSNSSLYLPSQKKSGNVTSSTLKTLRQHIHFVVTKKYGFTLQLEAVKYLEQVFSDYQLSRDEWESTLEFIVQAYRNHEAGHRLPIISKDDIHLIITRLEHHASSFSFSSTHSFLPSGKDTPPVYSTSFTSEDVQLTNLIHVIQAWDQPKWQFNIDTKTFQKIEKPNPLHGTAQSKALMYRERYDLIKQRILRNQNFRPASSTYYSNQNDRFFIITPISSIRGRANDSFVLFGMLCKYEDEKLYLEDPTGHVEIDISKAARSRGLFTETCFVVLDGIYTEDKKFIVKAMAMPPAEPRIGTIEVFGQLDFLGISQHEIYDQNQLKHFEEKYDGVNMVFLSNVYLDVPQVMNALRKLLTGCEDALCPLVMVFCGDFTSTTVPLSKYEQLWIR
ncbi:DNA-directed DNA polymerase epsilon, subunit B, partial [Coelomomyces lativittatus]